MSPRSALAAVAAALALPVLAGCGGDSAAAPAGARLEPGETASATVVVKNLKFAPKAVTVKAGQAVTWTFDDGGIPHDVKGSALQSPHMAKGTWTHRFDSPGTYTYICSIHPFMKGTVTVEG